MREIYKSSMNLMYQGTCLSAFAWTGSITLLHFTLSDYGTSRRINFWRGHKARRHTRCRADSSRHSYVALWIFPVVEGSCKFVAEAWPWLLHSLGLCCAIAGEFATCMGANSLHNLKFSVYNWHIIRKWSLPTSTFWCKENLQSLFLSDF
jgi:hypothetical protein